MNDQFARATSFLQSLGIQEIDGLLEPFVFDESRQMSLDLDDLLLESDTDSEAFHNALFVNERIAKRVLGSNFERICGSLDKVIELITTFQISDGRIADLGGGTGLTSLWAARNFPSLEFVVIDRAESPLKVGNTWASYLKIPNVTYEKASFEDVSSQSFGSFKFVLLDYVVSGVGVAEGDDQKKDEVPSPTVAAL